MPLSQRDQYSDRKGMGLIRLGAVLCLAAFVFGSVCFAVVAMMGEGEDPPKIYEQLGGASCGIFALGMMLGLIGWLISMNQPEPPKPTAASAGVVFEDGEDETPEAADVDQQGEQKNKPDPYASKHRRKDI